MEKFIRYIGSKEPILDFLISNFEKHCQGYKSFADMFAGTNVVSNKVLSICDNVQSFDVSSYSKVLSSFVNPEINIEFIDYLTYLDNCPLIESDFFNEFSINGKPKTLSSISYRQFFSENIGKKIDTIRTKAIEDYNKGSISEKKLDMVLAILLRFADINAHTTGVYGAFLKNETKKERPFLDSNLLNFFNNKQFLSDKKLVFKQKPISDSIQDIEWADLIYFDPPYTTRKYESNYHILEYLANINFNISDIKTNTISALPNQQIKNPFGSKKETPVIFKEMIQKTATKCKCLMISYSNQGLMKQEQIETICNDLNLSLTTETKEYKKYKSHNNSIEDPLYEILWIIKRK